MDGSAEVAKRKIFQSKPFDGQLKGMEQHPILPTENLGSAQINSEGQKDDDSSSSGSFTI